MGEKKIPNSSQDFELVYSSEKLQDVINFIGRGMFWSKNHSANVMETLISKNSEIPYAAIKQKNNIIKIAILILQQGKTEDGDKNIVNLSSWYAEPEMRGPASVFFARSLIKALGNNILTDYTPSEAVARLFKSLGFREMIVRKFRAGITRNFPYISIEALKLFVNWSLKKNSKDNYQHIAKIPFRSHLRETVFYSTHKIKNRLFSLKYINFYIFTGQQTKISLGRIILLMLATRSAFINFYCLKPQTLGSRAGWLIFEKEEKIEFISPLASEIVYLE